MSHQLTHFEIFGEEPAKLAEFYRSVLGWQIEKAPGVDYWRIHIAPGTPGGGLTFRPIPEHRSWVQYLRTDSVDGTVERVIERGGSVVREKTAVPKTAWYAVVADPEGNVFAIWEPDSTAMPPIEPDV
jgi:predicted enzyme related to lactoylglutathione lyase